MAAFFKKFPRINMKEAAAFMKSSKDAITSSGAQAYDGVRRSAKDGLLKTEDTFYRWEEFKDSNRRVKLAYNSAWALGSALLAGHAHLEMEAQKKRLNAVELAHEKHKQKTKKELMLIDQAHKEEMARLQSKIDLKIKVLGEEMEGVKQELLARQDVKVKEMERQVKEVERLLDQQPKPLVEQLKPFSRLIAKSQEDTRFQESHRRELGLVPPYISGRMLAPDFSAPKGLALVAKGK